jgi:hypothetical protein
MRGVVAVYLTKHTAMNKASAVQLLVTAEPVNFVVSRALILPPQAFFTGAYRQFFCYSSRLNGGG